MLNTLGHKDNGPPPSKCPIHPRNPPVPFLSNSMVYDVDAMPVDAFVGAGSVYHAQYP